MAKGGGGNTTTTTKADPWEGQQAYLKEQFADAQNLYKGGQLAPGYYPGQTIAPQSPQTQQAIGMMTDRATAGTPITPAAQGLLTGTLNGDYLNPQNNPGFKLALDDVANAYSRGTAAQTDAAFNRAGAYGGSAYKEMTEANNRAFGDSLTKLAGDMYQQERGRQMSGLLAAPSIGGMDYADIDRLAGAGAMQDAYGQDVINADIDRYNYTQNLPADALRNYISLTGGNYGGTNTTTQPYFENKGAGLLGGAIGGGMLGYGAAPLLGLSGPVGLAAGAGLGLLGGFF